MPVPTRADPAHSTGLRLGPLQPYAQDPAVTDIAVTCDGTIWTDRGEGMMPMEEAPPLRSPLLLRQLAVQLCAQLGARLDDANPIVDASTVQGLRLHAVIAPIVPQGAAISLRLPRSRELDLPMLAAAGMCPLSWVPMLGYLVNSRANLLITGATGSGKTTLLKALLMMCPPQERIVTVEEVRELGSLEHPCSVSLVVRAANVEGEGAVGLPELVKATLRMRPDRIVVGECRGEEIADMLRALNSGHKGAMTTLHANSLEQVPARLHALGLLAGLEGQALAMMAQAAFDVVLHLERSAAGRHIAQVGFLECVGGEFHARLAARWNGKDTAARGEAWDCFVRRCQTSQRCALGVREPKHGKL